MKKTDRKLTLTDVCFFCNKMLDPSREYSDHGHCDARECIESCAGYIPTYGDCTTPLKTELTGKEKTG